MTTNPELARKVEKLSDMQTAQQAIINDIKKDVKDIQDSSADKKSVEALDNKKLDKDIYTYKLLPQSEFFDKMKYVVAVAILGALLSLILIK